MMRLLLDTQVLLWIGLTPSRISGTARDAIMDVESDCLLSAINPWEMATKVTTGKLSLPVPLPDFFSGIERDLRATTLPVSLPHIWTYQSLPLVHRDPFDRMLIAQAITEGASIVSSDRALSQYGVTVIW